MLSLVLPFLLNIQKYYLNSIFIVILVIRHNNVTGKDETIPKQKPQGLCA